MTAIRVIVTDDSSTVRSLISRMLRAHTDIEVISTADDGVIAVAQAKKLQPDIMLLDIEMPNMDGLTALPLILEASPHTKVIIASTLTARNANISLKALQLGAADYLQKPNLEHVDRLERFHHQLTYKIRALGTCEQQEQPFVQQHVNNAFSSSLSPVPKAVAIAASTGGPIAITQLAKQLAGKLTHLPVFITQHMPATFTGIFADNINEAGGMHCKEAQHDEVVQPGMMYLAPGDYHMRVSKRKGMCHIQLGQDAPVNYCRPAADPMILSLTEHYGAELLLIVLTGMGKDGLNGATILHQAGGSIISQDKATSAVWGMPKAVYDANISSAVLPLDDIAPYILTLCYPL